MRSLPRQSFAKFAQFLPESAIIGKDPLCPGEYPFTLRGESRKALAALHDQHSKTVLQLLDSGRQRGLGDIAGGGGAREVLFARQRHYVFQVSNDHEACGK